MIFIWCVIGSGNLCDNIKFAYIYYITYTYYIILQCLSHLKFNVRNVYSGATLAFVCLLESSSDNLFTSIIFAKIKHLRVTTILL